MRYTECANGHVYDSDQHAVCPYCNKMRTEIQFGQGGGDNNKTIAPGMGGGYQGGMQGGWQGVCQNPGDCIMPINNVDDGGKTVAPDVIMNREKQDNKTIAIFQQEHGIDPVVGWLVCIRGKAIGKDYRLLARINTIGRSEENDVCIKGDKTISSRTHAKIAYDARNNQYMIIPGEGSNISYLNGQPIYTPSQLKSYDIIDFGDSSFLFIPLCGEFFKWDNVENQKG